MKAEDHLKIADEYLTQAQKNMPSDPRVAVLYMQEQTARAADHIDKAVALDPKATIEKDGVSVGADFFIADSLQMQGIIEAEHGWHRSDVARGMVALQKALKYRPWSANLNLSMAIGHLRLSQDDEARPYLDKTIELEPTNHRAHRIRDGQNTFLPAEMDEGQATLLYYATNWKLWITVGLFIAFGYNIYHMVQAFRYKTGEFLEYAFIVALLLGTLFVYQWIRGKLAST